MNPNRGNDESTDQPKEDGQHSFIDPNGLSSDSTVAENSTTRGTRSDWRDLPHRSELIQLTFPYKLPEGIERRGSFPLTVRCTRPRQYYDISLPLIPRFEDREHMRAILREYPDLGLPQWDVRANLPITTQIKLDEILVYNGFSRSLCEKYQEMLAEGRVPPLVIPYRDEDMKRVLLERGLVTQQEAENMVVDGPQGLLSTEGTDDEEHANGNGVESEDNLEDPCLQQ